ncbi:SRPBCC family protein [Chitinophaga tropicalis]|uniref:SRPBCC domain-containing protein n=1 Tax=Chitinophaga tropicalis TaxID=2683588 RepID=A0A7K1UDM6_9BACT|nr:SRPBCC domain-containing protein [Chitinophaga tropicalis]MVT12416.1 SRPBCC domain-containing protein [Chitinophaga tropicalis]
MEKRQFKTSINASRQHVWELLWGKDSYPEWTSVFAEGSHAETDWQKGSKVLFLDGQGRGMVSRVEENIPNEFMSFEHLGEVTDGKEDTVSEKVKQWAGAHENYTLRTVDGGTELVVDMDVAEEFEEMFSEVFPKALNKLKTMAEK